MPTHPQIDKSYREAALIRAGKADLIDPPPSWCSVCHKIIGKPLYCSACHTTRYCGRACQVRGWKSEGFFSKSHKIECAEIKSFMDETSEFYALLQQFPWGKMDKYGRFDYYLALALESLLGEDSRYGWWQVSLPQVPNTMDGLTPQDLFTNTQAPLLSEKHLDTQSGWKRPADEIPWLDFSEGRKPPPFPPAFEHNWTSYYKWRGLPLKSMAALLLHWPLSIYRLLFLLGFVTQSENKNTKRRRLTIHYIGAESELNFLPIFGELALLLPHTDLDILMFSSTIHKLARSKNVSPTSIISREYAYEYRAPKECGSGAVRIQLHKEAGLWNYEDLMPRGFVPDVLIALNAGISTFAEWKAVILTSRIFKIPFGVTDYGRICLSIDRAKFNDWSTKLSQADDIPEEMNESKTVFDLPPSIALNPFMRPGFDATLSTAVPHCVNGFTSLITLRSEENQ